MALSTSARDQLVNKLYRNTDFTSPVTVYVSLHSSDPGITGAGEIAGGSYSRKAITFSAPSGGIVSNSSLIEFQGMPAVTVTHLGLWAAASGGQFLMGGSANATKTYGVGDTCQIKASTLTAGLS